MIEIQKSLVVHFDGLQSVKLDGEPEICLKPNYNWSEIDYAGSVWFGQEVRERGGVEQKIQFQVVGQKQLFQFIELSNFCKLAFLHYAESGKVFLQGVEQNSTGFLPSAYKDTRVYVDEVKTVYLPKKHEMSSAWVRISGVQSDFAILLVTEPKLLAAEFVEAL